MIPPLFSPRNRRPKPRRSAAPPANQAPSAVIGHTPGPGRINATAVNSSDPDGTVVGWTWALKNSSGATVRTSTQESPDFTGLATDTYSLHLTVVDDDGASSIEESITGISVTAADTGDFVAYEDFFSAELAPHAEWVAGPQVTIGDGDTVTDRNPWPGYDLNATEKAAALGPYLPTFGPRNADGGLLGTISLTFGSTRVDGVGTEFLSQIGRNNQVYAQRTWQVNATNGSRVITSADGSALFETAAWQGQFVWIDGSKFTIGSIDSDTQVTLTANWTKASGTYLAEQWGPRARQWDELRVDFVSFDDVLHLKTPWPRADLTNAQWSTTRDSIGAPPDVGYFLGYTNYYDHALGQYILYFRTGDIRYRDWARTVADAWWSTQQPGPDYGTSPPNNSPRPHEASLGGLFLRALDEDEIAGQHGASEKWGWLLRYTVEAHDLWVYSVKDSAESIKGGNRFGGFAHIHVAWLAVVLPDNYTDVNGTPQTDGAAQRAALTDRLVRGSVDYYHRLQFPDGSWRWWESGTTNTDRRETLFHTGLMMEGQILAYELVKADAGVAQADKDAIREMIIRFADGFYGRGIIEEPPANFSEGIRGPSYTLYLNTSFSMFCDGAAALTNGSAEVVGTDTDFLLRAAWESHPVRFEEILAGTVAVTKGSTIVTGSGGADFVAAGLETGDWVMIRHDLKDAFPVRIASVDSPTQLILSKGYRGSTASGLEIARYWGDYHPSKVGLTANGQTMTGSGFNATLAGKSSLFLARELSNGAWQWDESTFTIVSDTEVTIHRAWKGSTGLFVMSPTFEGCYEVLSAASDTALTLAQTYTGPTLASARVLLPMHNPWFFNGVGQYAGTRQNNPETLHVFGYAYHITGSVKYLDWGDELFDASFASFKSGQGDGRTCLAYQVTGRQNQEGKSWNQAYRSTGHYLAWRIMPTDIS